jgi:CRP-like cAMP-binding protein
MEIQKLRAIKLFSGLADPDLSKILACAGVVKKSAGMEILCAGDQNSPAYFILSGSVKVFRINPDGREQTLIHLLLGDVFNLPTVFLEPGRAPASVTALVDSVLLRIERDDLRSMVNEIPGFNLAVLGDLSSKLEHLTEVIHDISLRSVRSRLARFLFTHSLGGNPSLWTQEQIAQQIGSTREAVNRALRELIKDGIIRTDRHKIIILDQVRLEAEIQA